MTAMQDITNLSRNSQALGKKHSMRLQLDRQSGSSVSNRKRDNIKVEVEDIYNQFLAEKERLEALLSTSRVNFNGLVQLQKQCNLIGAEQLHIARYLSLDGEVNCEDKSSNWAPFSEQQPVLVKLAPHEQTPTSEYEYKTFELFESLWFYH